jgi:hypothetical protein
MLRVIKRTDPLILANMAVHYSQPKGFVGRNICYEVSFNGKVYGHTVGGSAPMHLIGRDEFFGLKKWSKPISIQRIIDNIFFHVEGPYPIRNFVPKTIALFRAQVLKDWFVKYGDEPLGFETLVELPRTGECYLRDGWKEVGLTKGHTCKREAGKGTDSWGGRRVWGTVLRPKRVLCRSL